MIFIPTELDFFTNSIKAFYPPNIVHGVVLEVKAIGEAFGRLNPLTNFPESLSNTPIK